MKLATLMALAITLSCSHAAFAQDQKPGAHFMINWDLNADGRVTLEELRERRASVFVTFDENEDGLLDANDYVQFDEARAADAEGNGHSKSGARRMQRGMTLKFNDMDGDGKVSSAEFAERSAAWLEDVDRDGDGALTSADFGPRS